jgi:hypothetical protein
MTLPADEPVEADADYPERCLHGVWEELTALGFVIDEPVAGDACQCFFKNLRSAQCEMDLLVTRALVWEYIPLAGTSPGQAARLVLALLSGITPPARSLPPARYPGLALKDVVGRVLAACGMAVRLADVYYDYDDACTEAVVTNPAEPARGHVRVSDEGNIRWECSSPAPADPSAGLPPSTSPMPSPPPWPITGSLSKTKPKTAGRRGRCLSPGDVTHGIPWHERRTPS